MALLGNYFVRCPALYQVACIKVFSKPILHGCEVFRYVLALPSPSLLCCERRIHSPSSLSQSRPTGASNLTEAAPGEAEVPIEPAGGCVKTLLFRCSHHPVDTTRGQAYSGLKFSICHSSALMRFTTANPGNTIAKIQRGNHG